MGTWDWDVPAAAIWWDERMHALFGLAPGAFKGSYEDFLGLIHEEDRERIRNEFARAIEARTALDTEFQVAWPSDGSEHVVRIRSRVHCDENAELLRIVGVAWDITERRQTELALAKERNLLTTLMENVPYVIYFKDLDSRFIAVNRAYAERHGFKNPADLIGKSDRDLFSSEHAEAALADERKIIRTGKPIVDYEEKETWPDREDTWVSTTKMPLRDAQGHMIGTFGISRDITERRQTELALAKERNLLTTLMENVPYVIYFKDLDSRFIAVNRAYAEWHGFKNPADLIGKSDRDLFSSEHAEAALADERKIIRTGKPIVDYEEKETWPDREDTWVSTTKMPLRDAQGHMIGTFGISRDITEKKRAAEKLAQLTEELRAKNKSLEQDLEMARELQSALLPQRFPNFPHHATEQDSAVRFYPFFRPSMIVSGDFFDVLDISDDKAGLFICDVMGHGVRAALVAAIVRSVVSELRALWTKPGELLVAINRALLGAFRNSDITLFASAFYVVADLAKGQLRYANAGHPYPLHLTRSANGSTATASLFMGARPGPALGLFDGAKYETFRCKLSSRDVVLLFTDGLFEVEGSGGQLYDYQKLSRAVGDRTELPVMELCRSLIDEVQQFSATQEFNDDVCLVAMDIDRLKPLLLYASTKPNPE
jgi:phosphoserine phosphatase RsbU/P